MFSGQGSQYYHMGKQLYFENIVFRSWMSKINDIVYQHAGFSVVDKIYNEERSKADQFDDVLYTHLAIFMVEYSLARVLIESGIKPDYVLGASLGEFTSAAVTGAILVEDALECLLNQVKLITRYCQKGSMIAIIHSPELYNQTSMLSHHSELAGINYYSHFIISGDNEKLVNVEKYLKSRKIIFQNLPVRYGFHSSNIDPIGGEYKKSLCKFSFEKPKIPIISCLSSSIIKDVSSEHFWNVVRQPIQFQKTIIKLEEFNQFKYIDLGPSGTFASFVKRILSKDSLSEVYDVITPFGQEVNKLRKIKESFI